MMRTKESKREETKEICRTKGDRENRCPSAPAQLRPALNLNELPEALRHTMLIELARVFCRRLGRPRANDIELAGFPDLADLLMRGWILREPGRYSIGYQPGEPVIREMWLLDPTLCSVLRLPPPLVSRIKGEETAGETEVYQAAA
jgi:hypothetical protein